MIRKKLMSLTVLVTLIVPAVSLAQQPAMADSTARIRDEGMNRSQAMKTMRYLTDVIGPRLTNSPNQRRANKWTRDQFAAWGLENSVVEEWGEFGRGWELRNFAASVWTFVASRRAPRMPLEEAVSTARAVVACAELVSHVFWWLGRSEYDVPLEPSCSQ